MFFPEEHELKNIYKGRFFFKFFDVFAVFLNFEKKI